MDIKQIDYRDAVPIRQQMLRPGRKIEECYFEGDADELTFHLGAYINDKLASVASFYFRPHPEIQETLHQYQLRGMATLPDYQHKGFSRSLLETAFPIIKNNHVTLVWCNARAEAVGFYEKAGFIKQGDSFIIPDIGLHYLMIKRI